MRIKKILKRILFLFIAAVIIFIIYFNIDARISPPKETDLSCLKDSVIVSDFDFTKIKNNSLRKNRYGIWELYLEGNPFELGVYNGRLTKKLIEKQEEAFVEQLHKFIPNNFYIHFLKYFIAWFNRDIDEYIPLEYQQEIDGISRTLSDKYEFIAPNYQRMLNYHAAHDIGHALSDLALVGCTSFAVNMNKQDSSMLIGRNFDFYINDDFAENKVVCFVKPDRGYKFMYYTWASMIGVVSGMNEKGLTVTINAAKSDIPTKAATPISILARYILQYAKNIDEANKIAHKFKTFVSESILIGSAQDNKAVIIEKSPTKMGLYDSGVNEIVCANHFQSEAFKNDSNNVKNIRTTASAYREKRCWQLINQKDSFTYKTVASILRDTRGLNDENIGLGNEKAMNQLISHHSIIFQPQKLKVWVSTPPYQLGKYIEYDLKKVFNILPNKTCSCEINDTSFTIQEDSLLYSKTFEDYKKFVNLRHKILNSIKNNKPIENYNDTLQYFVSLNPEYYLSYYIAGDYLYKFKKYKEAKNYYNTALTKEFENTWQREHVIKRLENIKSEKYE